MRRHMMLVEALHLQQVLLESRIDFLKSKFLPILKTETARDQISIPIKFIEMVRNSPGYQDALAHGSVHGLIAEVLFDYVVSVDPDPVKKNTQWLLTLITRKNNRMPLEDLEYASESLTKFAEMKKARLLPPDKTDINTFKSLSDLNFTLRGEQENKSNALASEEQAMLKETKVIYNDTDYRILQPLTQKAACYFGRNTEWCTAWGNHLLLGLSQQGQHPTRTNYWDQYNSSPLYIIEDKKTNQIWQFSFGHEQFMDIDDRAIDIQKFFKDHPKIEAIFNELDGEPVGEILQHPVYALGRGFVVKSQKGVLGKVLLTATVSENGVLKKLTGSWLGYYHTGVKNQVPPPDKIAKLLTDFKITGDHNDDAVYDLYYRHGKWGTVADVGDVIYRSSGIVCKHAIGQHFDDFVLIKGNNEIINGHTQISDGELKLTYTKSIEFSGGILEPDVSKALADVLIDISNVKKFLHNSELSASDLRKEDIIRLAKAKPSLVDIPTAFEVYGNDSEVVKNKIIDWCDEHHLPYWSKTKSLATDQIVDDGQFIDDNLVIDRYDNIRELVDSIGNQGAKWFMSVVDGDEQLDFDRATAEKNNVRDLIKSLSPELLTKLGEYLQSNYKDEIEENFEDYDPSNADDVFEASKYDDNEEIQSRADWAVGEGMRYGAEYAMTKMLEKAVKNNSHVIFETNADQQGFQWDAPCYFVVSISDLARFIKRHGDADYTIYNEGWVNAFEAKIELEEPRYGFDEYDEKAAEEYFSEQIAELVG